MSPTGHLITCSGLLPDLNAKIQRQSKTLRCLLWFFTREINGSDENSDSNNNNNSSNSHLFGPHYTAGNMLGVLYMLSLIMQQVIC